MVFQPAGEPSDRHRKSNGGDRMLGVKGEGIGEDADGDAGVMLIWELVMMRIPVTECWGVKVLEV